MASIGITREIWTRIWRSVRQYNAPENRHYGTTPSHAYLHEKINSRATARAYIANANESGKVAVIHSGMDCDCSQFYDVTHIATPTPIAWEAMFNRIHQDAEGPCYLYLGKPSANPESYASSDRALEAFEDGHPHSVTWADLG